MEKRLAEWDAELTKREKTLEQQEAAFEEIVDGADEETIQMYADHFSEDSESPDGNDCGCTAEDAASNCDCPKCEKQRTDWVGTGFQPMRFDWSIGLPPERKHALMNNPVGDEVNWLENLWKLEDKRKKKK